VIQRLAIVGLGLMGGSLGLAARERAAVPRVVGWDPDETARAAAIERGCIDEATGDLASAVAGADVVALCAPVSELPAVLAELAELAPEATITDIGSTKAGVVAAVPAALRRRFIGGHPICGMETRGAQNARAELFDGATWYLTPTATTSGVLYERLHRLLAGLGARPAAIDAETHDTLLALVSHLPHVLANVLVAQAAATLSDGTSERLPATGPSFRDATRVAGASSSIWTDIYLSNRDALGAQLDETIGRLVSVRDALAAGDPEAITAWNDSAAADRRRLLDAERAGGDLLELRASVPNRPGVNAQLALELGRAGVNIADLALYPAADMHEGVVALWIHGEATAERAESLIGQLGFPVFRP
jgi:prephenate dehydrogenase